MSAIVPAAVFELHMARSKIIDGYNAADLSVRQRLQHFHVAEKAMLAENLLALEKVAVGPQYSKAAKKRVEALVAELRAFQSLRCDVVHGRMSVATVDGELCAMFSNVQKHTKIGRACLILTLPEMQNSARDMESIAHKLTQLPAGLTSETDMSSD